MEWIGVKQNKLDRSGLGRSEADWYGESWSGTDGSCVEGSEVGWRTATSTGGEWRYSWSSMKGSGGEWAREQQFGMEWSGVLSWSRM